MHHRILKPTFDMMPKAFDTHHDIVYSFLNVTQYANSALISDVKRDLTNPDVQRQISDNQMAKTLGRHSTDTEWTF